MKKITFLILTLPLFSSPLFINAQNSVSDSVVIDLSTLDSWDAEGDPDNVTFVTALDAFQSISPCDNPVLEVTGIAWDVVQQTIGASWLSEMVIKFDTDQDGTFDLFLTPSSTNTNGGNAPEANASGSVIDLEVALGNYLPAGSATTGNVDIELFEGFDDVADAVDGVWNTTSTVTLEYRLTCDNQLSLEENSLETTSVYPNPTKNLLTINSTQEIDYIELYDILGKRVNVYSGGEISDNSIDLSNVENGLYIIKIISGIHSKNIKITKQ